MSFCAFSWPAPCIGQSFSFDDIDFWVGSGANRAALVIDWVENSAEPPALAWGFRWDGTAHGNDMLTAIVAADPRVFAKLGGTPANPNAVFGLGYDADGDGEFGIDDGTPFDAQGFAFSTPADLAAAIDPGDYYAEGWFIGFWHYGVADENPYGAGAWSDTPVGMAGRALSDGSWDSWVFSTTFDFASFAENPQAAPPPFLLGDFDRDGRVDADDYALWRAAFGSTSDLAADASGNGIVDAADYVVWRRHLDTSAVSSSITKTVPEPHGLPLTLCSLCALWQTRFCRRKETTS